MAMSETSLKQAVDRWVNHERRTVTRSIFVDEDVYQAEQERIFARAWLFLGHESQIAKPGDYFVSRMGEEAVILTRDRQGEIHAFLNSCRHRGMKVCRYDEGNTPVFTCPYHGWSYGLDGSLVGVPYFKEAYHSELKKNEWGLVEVAQLANYKGTIWATWDKTAPSFNEFMGDMLFYLDDLLDGRDGTPGGSEVYGGVQKWITPTNWKSAAENRAGDGYHNVSHRSVDLVGIGPSGGRGRRDSEVGSSVAFNSIMENGHTIMGSLQLEDLPHTPTYQQSKIAAEWAEHNYYERQKNYGERARVLSSGGNAFPNFSFWCRQPRRIFVLHPGGNAMNSEFWSWFLVDANAPKEVKDILRHYSLRYSGPAGMTEQDDMENWNYATKASKGAIASRQPYNYQMGMNNMETHPALRGKVVWHMGEQNQFGMYAYWADLMASDSWDEVMARRQKRGNLP
jgi:phenylpropionate dioxygenase-like ring-hydroxylating dioxygenase large terminal subunit